MCGVCVRGALQHAHTHTHHFYNFKNFNNLKFSDFNNEPTSSLKMVWKDRNLLERF